MTFSFLSLFSGIGGLDLGLDRAGMTCVGQVEIDKFCRSVLARHWPEVPRHDDVRTAPGWWLGATRPAIDLVCGGFPCQPFSLAGRRRGVADERWGWPWFADIVRVVRPRYVLVENVAALLRDGHAFGWLLADLAEGGYDADWDCIPAAAVGANHRRDRLFLVAHARAQARGRESAGWRIEQPEGGEGARDVANSAGSRRNEQRHLPEPPGRDEERNAPRGGPAMADALRSGPPQPERRRVFRRPATQRGWWAAEPDVGRVAHGIPGRVDRLRGLGNAVVPQVAEHIGRLILAHADPTTVPA